MLSSRCPPLLGHKICLALVADQKNADGATLDQNTPKKMENGVGTTSHPDSNPDIKENINSLYETISVRTFHCTIRDDTIVLTRALISITFSPLDIATSQESTEYTTKYPPLLLPLPIITHRIRDHCKKEVEPLNRESVSCRDSNPDYMKNSFEADPSKLFSCVLTIVPQETVLMGVTGDQLVLVSLDPNPRPPASSKPLTRTITSSRIQMQASSTHHHHDPRYVLVQSKI